MIVLAVADNEVIFSNGNIVSIGIDEENPHNLIVGLINHDDYYFDGKNATEFLRQFPRNYFEKAPEILKLYDAFWLEQISV